MDDLGLLSDFSFVALLLLFEFGHEVVDLLLLLIQDLVLLHVIAVFLVPHVALNLLDVALVRVNDLTGLSKVFLNLFDFCIFLLDPVHKTLSGLREGQIHLVGLKLKVTFALSQLRLLFSQVLGTLLERVLLQPTFCLHQPLLHFVQLRSLLLDLGNECHVIRL